MRVEENFDFKNPQYALIFRERAQRLQTLRANPNLLAACKLFYKQNPTQFITDWGCTFDPRNPERQLPSLVPFILFKKQIEWVEWVLDHWKNQKAGLVEKTRTVGMSWLSIALSCTLCLFYPGLVIGFGSRKQEYVDLSGDLKALFPKARLFLKYIPREFLDGFDLSKNAPFMRILFPNGSQIVGESGDGIGRGARASIYFVDEAAFLERAHLIESSLSETTNCRIDISTPNGTGNIFAEKRRSGKIDVFTFHWRDDPRRDEEWYKNKVKTLDPVTVAQELDINYTASVENIVIPNLWIQTAIDAHKKLGIEPTGKRQAALDVADEGKDMNAFCGRHGILIDYLECWSGQNGDIFSTTQKAIDLCDLKNYECFYYDADGLGAGVRGDARIINEQRGMRRKINVFPFRGSGSVVAPKQELLNGRKNEDYFANAKAQAWWALRLRFQSTYRAVVEKMDYNIDSIISINSSISLINDLINELSQPTYSLNGVGKILIDKAPDGTRSPNLADAVMINFAPSLNPVVLSTDGTFWR